MGFMHRSAKKSVRERAAGRVRTSARAATARAAARPMRAFVRNRAYQPQAVGHSCSQKGNLLAHAFTWSAPLTPPGQFQAAGARSNMHVCG